MHAVRAVTTVVGWRGSARRVSVGHFVAAAAFSAVMLSAADSAAENHTPCHGLRNDQERAMVLLVVEMDGGKTERVGSGFIVTATGWMLTNNHVACHDTRTPGNVCPPGVKTKPGILKARVPGRQNLIPVRVIKRDLELDLALLRLAPPEDGHPYTFVKIAQSTALKPSDAMRTLGYPRQEELHCDDIGKVQNLNRERGWISTSNTINPGNSGGPVFNEDSKVVGVVHGVLEGANAIAFVIPIQHAWPMLMLIGPHWLTP